MWASGLEKGMEKGLGNGKMGSEKMGLWMENVRER
jgi:hypothetical protein